MEKARRRHVPAFGEWNHRCRDEPPATDYGKEGSEVWFKPSPPPRRPFKKKQCKGEKGARRVRVSDADTGAHTPGKEARVVVMAPARAVDADLYQVPADLLSQKPRRKRMARSLWMGCLGFDCIA